MIIAMREATALGFCIPGSPPYLGQAGRPHTQPHTHTHTPWLLWRRDVCLAASDSSWCWTWFVCVSFLGGRSPCLPSIGWCVLTFCSRFSRVCTCFVVIWSILNWMKYYTLAARQMISLAGNLLSPSPFTAADLSIREGETWSEILKRSRRRRRRSKTKKNVVVVRGIEANFPTNDVKNELWKALEGIQSSDTGVTNDGKIVVNFVDETVRNEAAQKITNVDKLSVKTINKLKPQLTGPMQCP